MIETNLTQLLNKGLFGEPAILLGIIALLGLLLKKEKPQQIMNGTIKTMLGYILLQIGASAAGSSLSNLSIIIQRGFQVIGIIPHNETITAFAQLTHGDTIAIIMLIGMITHLAIARFTPLKYVFLTGHHILFMASLLATLLAGFPLLSWQLYLFGGLILALSMSVSPAITQPFVRKVTGSNDFAIGHFNSFGYVLTGCVALAVKSKSTSTVSSKVKRIQPFFQDQTVVIALFTLTLFVLASIFATSKGVSELFSGRHIIVVSITQAIWFAGGVYIILHGVRMMLTEIIPAFQSIAHRFVPGSIPAMDCPVLFSYSPLAAVFGFLLSFFGGILAMIVLFNVQYTVIIPGVIPHFFSGGAAGVFAYKLGNRRGLFVATTIHGFVITILPSLLVPALEDLGFVRATFADSDFSIVGLTLYKLLQWIF